jgi:hypothetical protein
MSSLGGSTVSSSYNRLLVLPAGGGDANNLVTLSDGDNATTFALKVSANAISINTGEKFYLDGGTNSYITESENGIMDFYTAGKLALRLNPGGVSSALYADQLYIGHGDLGLSTDSRLNLQSQKSSNGTAAVHAIEATGDNYSDDVILLGRTDNTTSSNTNVVLNAKVGIGTHYSYPRGPEYALRVLGTDQQGKDWYPQFIADTDSTNGVSGTAITSVGVNSEASVGWARGYTAVKHSDIKGTPLIQFGFHGSVNSIHRAFIGKSYTDYMLSCETDNRRVAIVGGTTGVNADDGWGGSVGGDGDTGTTEYSPDGILTIQQGTDDSKILTFKSTDVGHNFTSVAETDTFATFAKKDGATGGLQVNAIADNTPGASISPLGFKACGTAMNTNQSTGYMGMIDFMATLHDNAGNEADLTANGNVFAVGGQIGGVSRRIFIIDTSGDLHCDAGGGAVGGTSAGTTAATVFDEYNDAQLVRALDMNLPNTQGLIENQWDEYIDYNEQTLIDAGILGDKLENGGMTNITRLQRLHNGAIWQQYEQFQNLLQAFTKVSNEVIGKEATKELLDSNNIKKLGDA